MTSHEIQQLRREYMHARRRASSRQRGYHLKLRRRARRSGRRHVR